MRHRPTITRNINNDKTRHKTRHDDKRKEKTREDKTGQGKTGEDKTRHTTRQDKTQDKTQDKDTYRMRVGPFYRVSVEKLKECSV